MTKNNRFFLYQKLQLLHDDNCFTRILFICTKYENNIYVHGSVNSGERSYENYFFNRHFFQELALHLYSLVLYQYLVIFPKALRSLLFLLVLQIHESSSYHINYQERHGFTKIEFIMTVLI